MAPAVKIGILIGAAYCQTFDWLSKRLPRLLLA
jgi:hypothetical protein